MWSAAPIDLSPSLALLRRLLHTSAIVTVLLSAFEASAAVPPSVVDLASYADAVEFLGVDPDDWTGNGIAACDINGDGIGDLVIPASEASGPNNSRTWAGEVYLIYGRRGRWHGTFDLTAIKDVIIYGEEAFDGLGEGIACGDINADGYDDIIMGAADAESLNNARFNAGQAHIVFGSENLPPVIDLVIPTGTTLWGEEEGDNLGAHAIAVGDFNGDGTPDVAVPADRARNVAGTFPTVGQVHLVFGRATWPASVDLATDTDVLIHGDDGSDLFGRNLGAHDLDGDGVDELIVAAIGGDGPDNGRASTGTAYVFRGRQTWPAMIDLAVSSADIEIHGAEPYDKLASSRDIHAGDLDNDGTTSLLLGAAEADGRDNHGNMAGEGYELELGSGSWPLVIDLAEGFDSIIYGGDEFEYFCNGLQVADVNVDGTDDWICDAGLASGPGGTRPEAGQIHVFYGRSPWPAEQGIDHDEQDMVIYGPEADNWLLVKAISDLNGDGVPELVGTTNIHSDTIVPSVWLIGPQDTDGDGISQLADNCPLVANPGQADADADLVGDACEDDYDGDGQLDESDCAPGDASGGTPAEITGLAFDPGSTTELRWNPAAFSDTYDLCRTLISQLDGSDFGACQNHRDPDLGDTSFEEDELPPDGDGFALLVRGHNDPCALAGSYGPDSAGSARQNSHPSDCP